MQKKIISRDIYTHKEKQTQNPKRIVQVEENDPIWEKER